MPITMRGAQHEGAAKPPLGQNSHAEGAAQVSNSAATNAHAEGAGNASGASSHAEGGGSASGNTSHAEGSGVASGTLSHAEGNLSTASGNTSHAEGDNSTAAGIASHAQGKSCIASGDYSHAQGQGAVAPRIGQSSLASLQFGAFGDSQLNWFVPRALTTNSTPVDLFLAATLALTGSTASVLTIPINRGHRFRIEAVARRSDSGDEYAGWTITGTIVRGPSGNARFLGTPVVVTECDAAAAAWTLAVSVNTSNATNNYLAITATGEAAKSIRWVAALTTSEVG